MFLLVPRCAFPILIIYFLLAPRLFAQYSSLPPGEDHPILGSKLQKELGKALEALRANKPADARNHLDAVYRSAPGDADANFLFGVYSSQINDWVHARSYWEKVLTHSPNHLGALLSLGGALMLESKPNEAAQYLTRAVEAEPTSWRAHAVLADAYLREGRLEDSINEAARALE
jgi:predicted Zn-dependent protease